MDQILEMVINSDQLCYPVDMDNIPVAAFKARCLAILKAVPPEGVVITKHGRPIARIVPVETTSAQLIGSLRGRMAVRHKADLFSTGISWRAQS